MQEPKSLPTNVDEMDAEQVVVVVVVVCQITEITTYSNNIHAK